MGCAVRVTEISPPIFEYGPHDVLLSSDLKCTYPIGTKFKLTSIPYRNQAVEVTVRGYFENGHNSIRISSSLKMTLGCDFEYDLVEIIN